MTVSDDFKEYGEVEGADNAVSDDPEEFTEAEEATEGDEQQDQDYLTQDDFDRAIRRKHAQWERGLARKLGFRNVEEALPYIRAGKVVSERSGVAPGEVVNRLNTGAVGQNPQVPGVNPLEQRLNRIEDLLEDDRTVRILKSQEAQARKEFGDLYDEYQEDIEDKADELGLSLPDAAAVVLRPRLREHAAAQMRAKKQSQRRRKVEGSGESPSTSKPDYATLLSPAQREAAKKTGVSLERYYNQLRRLGRIK